MSNNHQYINYYTDINTLQKFQTNANRYAIWWILFHWNHSALWKWCMYPDKNLCHKNNFNANNSIRKSDKKIYFPIITAIKMSAKKKKRYLPISVHILFKCANMKRKQSMIWSLKFNKQNISPFMRTLKQSVQQKQ